MGRPDNQDISPTFCVNPWIQQTALPTGRFGFCCVAVRGGPLSDSNGKALIAPQSSLEDAWNSGQQREIRQQMLRGEKVPGCANCYFQESIGKKSAREMLNDEWFDKVPTEVIGRVNYSRLNDGAVDERALYLDLRLGNLCNLKCRTCNPFNSTKIFSETLHLRQTNPEFKEFYDGVHDWKLTPIPPWFEDESFWSSVERHLPQLRKVYLTGGEPTLIKRNLKFIKNCISTGHAKHIFLMFNTNCTHLTEEFLELLPQFEFTLVNCSIDGIGPVNDYIREGSEWPVLDKNLRRLSQLGRKVQIGVTPVVQIYNILDLVPLMEYIDALSASATQELNVDFLYANSPSYFDIRNLPSSVKSVAYEEIDAYRHKSKLYKNNSYMRNSVDSVLNALAGPRLANAEKNLEVFLKYTRFLDEQRGRSMRDTFPRLHSLLAVESGRPLDL